MAASVTCVKLDSMISQDALLARVAQLESRRLVKMEQAGAFQVKRFV